MSPKTVQQWDGDGLREAARLKSKGREAQYDGWAAIRWWHNREMERLQKENVSDDLDAARLRKLEAEAESKELDVQVKRGELVPMDEMEGLLRESLESVDSVLRHAPAQFAPVLAKQAKVSVKESRSILRDIIEMVRGAIREGGRAT